jgi:hypothetical protein
LIIPVSLLFTQFSKFTSHASDLCTDQDQDEPPGIVAVTSGIHDTKDTKDIVYCLPHPCHGDNPGVCLLVNDGLDEVCQGCYSEKDGHDVCTLDGGTKRPQGIFVVESCVWVVSC